MTSDFMTNDQGPELRVGNKVAAFVSDCPPGGAIGEIVFLGARLVSVRFKSGLVLDVAPYRCNLIGSEV